MPSMPLGKVMVTPRGNFALGTEYKKLDTVYDAVTNASYMAITDNKDTSVTDTTKWMCMAKGVGDGTGGSDNNYTDADKAKVTALPEANPGTAGGLAQYDALKAHLDSTDNPHKVTAAQVGVSNPNLLINPCGNINQRGSASYTASGYTLDRWMLYRDSTVSVEVSQGGAWGANHGEHFFRLVINAVTSDGGDSFVQLIEDDSNGYSPLSGKTVTFSILANSTTCDYRTMSICYYDSSNVAHGIGINIPKTAGTFSVTGTIPLGSHRVYVQIGCSRHITSNDVGTYFDFTETKLELGSVPTPFVPRPYAEELALCQRYTISLNPSGLNLNDLGFRGYANSATQGVAAIPLPTQMRCTPTLAITATNFQLGFVKTGTYLQPTSYTIFSPNKNTIVITFNGTGLIAGEIFDIRTVNPYDRLILDAEIY